MFRGRKKKADGVECFVVCGWRVCRLSVNGRKRLGGGVLKGKEMGCLLTGRGICVWLKTCRLSVNGERELCVVEDST